MKKENTIQPTVEETKTSSSIYSEDNLITGSQEEQATKEFQETVEKTIEGVIFDEVQEKSIRIRKKNKLFTQDEAKSYEHKNVEIIDVTKNHNTSKFQKVNMTLQKSKILLQCKQCKNH